jgi:hypothetical protein
MTMLAAIVLMGLSEAHTDQIHLTMPNSFLGYHLLGKLANGLRRTPQADRLKALVVIQMHVHRSRRQFMVSVLQRRQAFGQLAFMVVVDVGQAGHAKAVVLGG